MKKKVFFILWLLLLCTTTIAAATDLSTQRAHFLVAWRALQHGYYAKFIDLSNKLDNYPLHPYLEYADLLYRIRHVDPNEIEEFLQEYEGTPLADKLRGQWLNALAKQQRFAEFKAFYRATDNAALQCWYRQAQWRTGEQSAALLNMQALWLTGSNQPKSCDAVFKTWRAMGGLTPALVWQRIGLAFNAGNKYLASSLSHLLPPSDRHYVTLWLDIYQNPMRVAQGKLFAGNDAKGRDILVFGIQRLAKKQPEKAVELWRKWQTAYPFSPKQYGEVTRFLALHLATDHHPNAEAWLNQVPQAFVDQPVREWRIRTALLQGQWKKVRYFISQLPEHERKTPGWQYWDARALAALGMSSQARVIFQSVAKERSYYGFLASSLLGQAPNITSTPVSVTTEELQSMIRRPSFARSAELYRLHWLEEARREWQAGLRGLTPKELNVAAKLAQSWLWYERAIMTAAKSGNLGDLTLRFPLLYKKYITFEANRQHLDPAWIFAVIRQESIFMADAKSSAGAIGLMQLMPMTARMVAVGLKHPYHHPRELLQVATNIHFGSHYLRQMLDTFHGDMVLATASYNAGPGRVGRFRPKDHPMVHDIWIETMPWRETRDYVKNVLAFTAIYQSHLGVRYTIFAQGKNGIFQVW